MLGLITAEGDINWNCPCLGGMATGPCGYEFRSAFSCFHYSKVEPKGADCYEEFKQMQDCMAKFPKLYDTDKDTPDLGALEDEDLDLSDTHANGGAASDGSSHTKDNVTESELGSKDKKL